MNRIVSLDQFRGYTVAGMFLVNFVGGFVFVQTYLPTLKHWHDHCSYADTIMPQFLFAVGFAYRLTFLRRLAAGGRKAAYGHALSRILGLLLVAFVVHHLDGRFGSWAEIQARLQELGPGPFLAEQFQRNFFQTLAHIAVTSLWALPVIGARPWLRVAYLAGSALLHVWVAHAYDYYAWEMRRPGIDGGPLGFLTWAAPLLIGSLAYDCWAARGPRAAAWPLLGWGLAVMVLAYALANLNPLTPPNATPGEPLAEGIGRLPVEPPFVRPTRPGDGWKNYWVMSQRAGSIPYPLFGAGFALAVFALFVLACDVGGLQLGLFRTLGGNALAGYIIHDLVGDAVKPYAPRDAPGWYVAAAFAVFFTTCYVLLRYLEKHRLFLRL